MRCTWLHTWCTYVWALYHVLFPTAVAQGLSPMYEVYMVLPHRFAWTNLLFSNNHVRLTYSLLCSLKTYTIDSGRRYQTPLPYPLGLPYPSVCNWMPFQSLILAHTNLPHIFYLVDKRPGEGSEVRISASCALQNTSPKFWQGSIRDWLAYNSVQPVSPYLVKVLIPFFAAVASPRIIVFIRLYIYIWSLDASPFIARSSISNRN